jgi:hypothetical protein
VIVDTPAPDVSQQATINVDVVPMSDQDRMAIETKCTKKK